MNPGSALHLWVTRWQSVMQPTEWDALIVPYPSDRRYLNHMPAGDPHPGPTPEWLVTGELGVVPSIPCHEAPGDAHRDAPDRTGYSPAHKSRMALFRGTASVHQRWG